MSIVLFLGKSVKEYKETYFERIKAMFDSGQIMCEISLTPMKWHLTYSRKIKEMGERIWIVFAQCTVCRKHHGHALQPDFLLPHKHYSAKEIESVIIDSAECPAKEIVTMASESTVRRWIEQIGSRIIRAVSILKATFIEMGRAFSEVVLDAGHCYSELEQMLEMAPSAQRHSNKLGLANLWLSRHNRKSYI